MMTDLQAVGILIATILGAITTATLGYLDSSVVFDVKKFIPSLIRGILAAVALFSVYYLGYVGDVTVFTYAGAFGLGGTIDVIGNRAAGVIGVGQGTTTTSSQPSQPPAGPTNFRRMLLKLRRFYVFRLSK